MALTISEGVDEIGTFEVFRRLGVTAMADQAAINRWVAAEVVIPSVHRGIGSGSRNVWTPFDVERLRRIMEVRAELHARGMELPYHLVGEIWETLGRGERWELSLAVDSVA